MSSLAKLQGKYQKPDTDTILNELHDAIVGHYLGFGLINTNKHGFDCKMFEKNIYLENKCSSSINGATATFNDTNLEKANVFKDEKTWLALSVWKNAAELSFICFGQNEKIGEYLEERVKSVAGTSTRSTQSISLSTLIMKYDFHILTLGQDKDTLFTQLTAVTNSLNKMDRNIIIELKDFNSILDYKAI